MKIIALTALMIIAAVARADAGADTLCTIVADTQGKVLLEQGPSCDQRVTPASTFKVPLAVMGYDAGFLKNADEPVLPFRKGDPDWIAEWRKPTGPAGWMRHSVLWYSQRIAEHLGKERFAGYVSSFAYGNADVSGDPGKDNALERSWVSSSLKISPREQVVYFGRLATGRLPVSADAQAKAIAIVERHAADKWTLHGKTGSAYPRNADSSFDRAHGWGWYVGWAERDGRTVVFAHLRQDRMRQKGPMGLRARDDFIGRWTTLASQLPPR